jgi:hypothetical protein
MPGILGLAGIFTGGGPTSAGESGYPIPSSSFCSLESNLSKDFHSSVLQMWGTLSTDGDFKLY